MTRIAQGDQQALSVLIDRHQGKLGGFLHRQTGGRDVEDLLQETWLRVVRAASRFDPQRRFTTWMFQIAVNQARDWRRKAPAEPVDTGTDTSTAARFSAGSTGPADTVAASASSSPAAVVEAAIDAERLLSRLDIQHREVLELRYFQDLAESEVAAILGIPRGTVKSRLHNGLRKLAAFAAETPLHNLLR